MDFDLDMEFVPKMELYDKDSDDDFVNEEIYNKQTKSNKMNKTNKTNNSKKTKEKTVDMPKCEICENPNTIHIKYNSDGYYKNHDFCRECNSELTYKIENDLILFCKDLDISLPIKKRVNEIIRKIIQNSADEDDIYNKINNIIDTTITKYKTNNENFIPFDNVKMLDYQNNFCCFTTIKRMNKFIKENSVELISDKVIKWKNPKLHSRNFIFQISENNMKENKCFICENTKFIKSLSIFPDKTNLSLFLKDNVLIHFFFAFCSKCRDICIKNREICNEYFKNILLQKCDDYIEELYKNSQNDKIMDFINEYVTKFKQICIKHKE